MLVEFDFEKEKKTTISKLTVTQFKSQPHYLNEEEVVYI